MKDRTIVFLTHLVIISLLVITGKVFAASPAIIKWDAVIEDTPVHGIASGVTATESAPAMPEFMTAMSRQGVKASQSDGKLKLSGQQSLDQFRSILFDDETEQINLSYARFWCMSGD